MLEAEFKKQAEKKTWTMASVGGQKSWRILKWEIADALFKGRWPNPNAYEVCARSYNLLAKTYHAEDAKQQ